MTPSERKNLTETMRRLKICVIMPTYNNAGTLHQVVSEICDYSDDVIVVNDGSTDDTKKILESFGERIHLVSFDKNKGKGHALKKGFKEALRLGYSYAITIDSDGQHYPKEIPSFVKSIAINPDALILGERNLETVDINGKSSFANKFSNFWFTVHTGWRLKDTQTGYRAYPLKKISGLSLLTSRYEAELELLVLSAWAGVKLVSLPIDVHYPPRNERVSHFRPALDFTRISILNTLFCLLALIYGYPRYFITKILRREIFNREFKPFTRKKGNSRNSNLTIGRIFRSLYALSHFLFWSVIVFKPYVFFSFTMGKSTEKKRSRLHRRIQRISSFFSKNFPGGKARVENPYKEDFSKPAIVISNHQSNLDLPIMLSVSPKLIFITKDWVWNNKFFGPIIHEAEFIPISWGIESLIDRLRSLVKKGYSIVIFPEGSRSEDGRIGRFRQGAFALARELQLDIVPMVLHGPSYYLPKNDFMLGKNPQTLRILKRIPYGSFENVPVFKEASAFRSQIKEEYEKIESGLKPSFYKSLVLYKFAYRGWSTVKRAKRQLRNLSQYEDLISGLRGNVCFFCPGIGAIPIMAALANRSANIICCVESSKDYELIKSIGGLPPNLEVKQIIWDDELKKIAGDAGVFVIDSPEMADYLQEFDPILLHTRKK